MRFKGVEKLGLTEENLRNLNPDVIFSYVSAYAQRGERGAWPGYDSIFTAIAGWEFENGGEGNPPMSSRPGPMDILAAQSCLVGTIAALYARRAGGDGHSIATSLFGVATLTQSELLILPDGSLSETYHLTGDQTGFGPYHRLFEASDGWIAIAAHTEARREGVRAVLGADEAGFAAAARAQTVADLLAALEAQDVPCDRIGQHTDEILRDLGYTDAEIAALREKQIIG